MKKPGRVSCIQGKRLIDRPCIKTTVHCENYFDLHYFRLTAMSRSRMNSSADDWQKYFDARAYLKTYYDEDMFTRPGRFAADYLSQIAERMHRIMATGKITLCRIFEKIFLNRKSSCVKPQEAYACSITSPGRYSQLSGTHVPARGVPQSQRGDTPILGYPQTGPVTGLGKPTLTKGCETIILHYIIFLQVHTVGRNCLISVVVPSFNLSLVQADASSKSILRILRQIWIRSRSGSTGHRMLSTGHISSNIYAELEG